MSELPTDIIHECINISIESDASAFRVARSQLQALLDDRNKWRNRSLAIEECLQDFDNQWQHARDYPSKHDNTQEDKQ